VVNPGLLALSTTAVALVTGLLSRIPGRTGTGDRRFEAAELNRIIPAFLLYLLLLAVWPPTPNSARWTPEWGLVPELDHVSTDEVMSLLEYIAGFTLLGYALAARRGRREEPTASWCPARLSSEQHVPGSGTGLRISCRKQRKWTETAMSIVAADMGRGCMRPSEPISGICSGGSRKLSRS
jgi:hypothetical protein